MMPHTLRFGRERSFNGTLRYSAVLCGSLYSAVLCGTLRMRHLPNDLAAAELAFLAIPASAQNTDVPTVSTLTSITSTVIPIVSTLTSITGTRVAISAGCPHSHQHTPLFRVSARPATQPASGERAARGVATQDGLINSVHCVVLLDLYAQRRVPEAHTVAFRRSEDLRVPATDNDGSTTSRRTSSPLRAPTTVPHRTPPAPRRTAKRDATRRESANPTNAARPCDPRPPTACAPHTHRAHARAHARAQAHRARSTNVGPASSTAACSACMKPCAARPAAEWAAQGGVQRTARHLVGNMRQGPRRASRDECAERVGRARRQCARMAACAHRRPSLRAVWMHQGRVPVPLQMRQEAAHM